MSMKLSEQVCTLEQAKALDRLGLQPNEGFLFAYYERLAGENLDSLLAAYDAKVYHEIGISPAFTVAELGVLIYDTEGDYFTVRDNGYYKGNEIDGFSVWQFNGQQSADVPEGVYPTEAQARAALLIHLLETGKVTPDEVNARLNS